MSITFPGMNAHENPFPGMNPFFEMPDRWPGIHGRLLTYIGDALSEDLPPDLHARTEERVVVDFPGESEKAREYRADVAVVESWKEGLPPVWQPEGPGAGEPIVVAEPEIIVCDPAPERWIAIRDVEERLITVIEVLSPSNKKSPGRAEYVARQRNFLSTPVNLVEIDLLRGGGHVASVNLELLAEPPKRTRFLICVRRSPFQTRREIYRCPLRERLPAIRIPLRFGEPDVALDLQPPIDRCYRTGRDWLFDYRREPEPEFPPDEAAWVDERLRAAGLR